MLGRVVRHMPVRYIAGGDRRGRAGCYDLRRPPVADMRERENGCGTRRLGFAVPDLVACSLELPADMDLGGIKVDIRPGEPECLAAQPENEDQHVGAYSGS